MKNYALWGAKALVTALLGAFATAGWAGLGGTPAKLGAQGIAAAKTSGALARYTEIETRLDSGVTIREYLAADGTVFAVSWTGPFLPDLKELLGPHFKSLVAHQGRGSSAGRSRAIVRQDDVVIVSGGHMGAFEGRAWLPARLPAGFDPEDIR